ncbi:MAG: ribonuclease HII [Gammaproteobacteria bacterium]|nr:ribonuclease HII [Gammaproteobacteria bacterium]
MIAVRTPAPPRGPVAGVDEAGRGPLAGPVVAAAVILDPARPIPGLRDSKALAEPARIRLAAEIRGQALAWAIGWSDAGEIDVLDILQATLLAMRRALQGLALAPGHVRVDGNRCPSVAMLGFPCSVEAIVGGDARIAEISAASILAKTSRDAWMTRAALIYPGYDFERHKGYPTPDHLRLLAARGPCSLHRQSFAPVRSLHAPS